MSTFQPRNLGDVINQVVAVDPELKPLFKDLLSRAGYAAPELAPALWTEFTAILNRNCMEHPKRDEIAAIVSGKVTLPPNHEVEELPPV